MRGRAVLDDPLAFTELHLTFENPEDRVLEGTFSIVLPQGAAISRFAMKNDAGFQEGEVVEKQQARVAYEDFLHRRQDPALLEQAGGNEFSARVFPIPARGKKELIVSFSQELSRRAPYVLPLKGLPEIGDIDVEVHAAGRAAPVASLVKKHLKPEADLRVEAGVTGDRAAVRNGNLVLARVTPVVGSQPEPLAATLFLIDTSASRALGMAEQGRLLSRLCARLARSAGPKTQVVVAAYDQTIDPVYDGPADGFGDGALVALRQRLALGASNIEAALGWAARNARPRGIGRVVLVTDGVPTAGQTAGDKLRAAATALKGAGVERLDAIALGGIRDDALLRSLVNAGLPRGGIVADPSSVPEEDIWRRLNEATRSGIEVKVEGAAFTFPSKIDGVQAGDEVLVYANVPDDKPVRISVGGAAFTEPTVVKVERPLLERAWVGAKIKSLVERERVEGASDALSREIVGLSTKFRVLSPKTSLLVLETDWDYARFGIDRRALADVLVADGGSVSLLHRTLPAPPKAPPTAVATAKTSPAKPKATGSKGRREEVNLDGGSRRAPGGVAGGVAGGVVGGVVGGVARGAAAPASRAPARPASIAPPATEDKKADEVATGGSGWSGPAASASPVAVATATAPPAAPRAGGSRSAADRGEGYGHVLSDPSPAAAPAPAASVAPPRDERAASRPEPRPAPPPSPPSDDDGMVEREPDSPAPLPSPYTGPFKTVMDLVQARQVERAIQAAFDWRKSAPGDVMALVALGEGFEAAGDTAQAARCYGSIIDLFPARSDLRRFAGERLERLALPAALDLAADSYRKAEIDRPDHPASHRLLAFALVKQGKPQQAFEAIERGLRQSYPSDRFRGVPRILQEDLGLIGAAWAKAEPARADEIRTRVRASGGSIEDEPSLRFVLNWETDANDVDFHIHDAQGGHAFYSHPLLPSGGELYADVTTGYGPECFTIRAPAGRRAGPYRLQAHYYSRGPMGYGMGKLEIIEHDGHGGLTFEERPFVVMLDSAFVDLGVVKR
ncbi:MAG: VIT domain-containing protein [Polyangiaceae bacterium]